MVVVINESFRDHFAEAWYLSVAFKGNSIDHDKDTSDGSIIAVTGVDLQAWIYDVTLTYSDEPF